MLKICLLTENETIKSLTELLLNENKIDYQIINNYEPKTTLVIGDEEQIVQIQERVMTIAIMNTHQYESELTRNSLCNFIERDEISNRYISVFNEWLDYYFENYHYNISETQDFMLDDVLYFHLKTLKEVEVVLKNQTISYQVEDSQIYTRILPLNFIVSGNKYMINMDYIEDIKGNEVIMCNGQVFTEIAIQHIKNRDIRKEKTTPQYISIGDFPQIDEIKKAKKTTLSIGLFLCFGLGFYLQRVGIPYLLSVFILALLCTPLYRIFVISSLQISGNFYQLRDDAIYYYDCMTIKQKAAWINAIEKGATENLMTKLPFEDIAYLRLKTREARSMIGGAFMHFNHKTYALRLIIETTTSSIEFNDVTMFGELLQHQIITQNTIASFINNARFKGADVQENEELVYVLNDPNATLNQYLNKKLNY